MNMAPDFDPTVENQRLYRDALGTFATGVTVVSIAASDGALGMTANSFSSVSLDPPLVLWCPAKSSHRYEAFVEAETFAIQVLRDDQKALALEFARRGDAFDQVDWHEGDARLPLIDDCLARFECRTTAVHDAGDHSIMVGKVTHVVLNTGNPLVFAQRAFGGFANPV